MCQFSLCIIVIKYCESFTHPAFIQHLLQFWCKKSKLTTNLTLQKPQKVKFKSKTLSALMETFDEVKKTLA